MSYSCPLPLDEKEIITLAHGSGGKQTHKLIEELFLPAFHNEHLAGMHDGACLTLPQNRIVFTTDSFVVQPLFFPGGDIGKLAITGTVNDLAMCGAKPLYLSCGFVIEEGIAQRDLKAIVASMQKEAEAEGLQIVAGDTKVIERQTGNNLFINTSGIGVKMGEDPIHPRQIQEGDAIVLSGDIGRHGMAIMAKRENLEFSQALMSDCASLVPQVAALFEKKIALHCLRDLTRGGLATALVEVAETAQMDLFIEEEAIAVSEAVESACELLGLDPLYVANEGRFVAFVSQPQVSSVLEVLKRFSGAEEASVIGSVRKHSLRPNVLMKNPFGTERRLYRLVGDQLPRIC